MGDFTVDEETRGVWMVAMSNSKFKFVYFSILANIVKVYWVGRLIGNLLQ